MVTFDPNRPDFTPYGFTCVRWTPSPMKRPDHHNEVEVNLLMSGWVTYLFGGRKVKIEAGRLTMFWAAIPHQIIDHGMDTKYFVATIPFPWFLQCKLPDKAVQPLLRGVMISEPKADRIKNDIDLFSQWETDLRKPTEEMSAIVMLEMKARLLRLVAELPDDLHQRAKGAVSLPGIHDGQLNKVEQMVCMIAQRYTEPLTVENIAKAAGLHPNYAMSLFKKAFGTTLIDYLTHHRVSHAQRLLATTDMKIVEVAYESGFNSISRFNEAFRSACDYSPREYRRMHAMPPDQLGVLSMPSMPAGAQAHLKAQQA